MMKQILACFLILASLFVTTSALAQDTLPSGDFQELKPTGTAKVTNIIDPQTIQLDDGRIIRLTGLNFPDFDFDTPGKLSLTAIKILKHMLEGQDVHIYQTKRKDLGRLNRMGHHIAHLERQSDRTWAQGSLLTLGVARVQTSQRNREMAQQMIVLEQQARKDSLGLWAEGRFPILRPAETINHLKTFQIVEGSVKSATIKKNRIYLNFGQDWRSDFTVTIAPKDRRLFSKMQIDPLTWNGQKLRVRGWLDEYNGPYIEVDHPEAIEVLDQP